LRARHRRRRFDDLKNDGKNPDNVLTYGMGYSLNRYSPLKQIDKATVKRLVPIWNLSLDNPWGEQAQPLVLDGVMYVTNARATVAIDVGTGKEIWNQKAAEWKEGYSMTVAPLIANNVLITGISGAEFGIRGFIDGWDPETGKHLWRRYTIPARGEPGNETWPQDNDAWKTGGGSSWITGSYDPDLDLTYWGTGNPAPWASQTRPGDNLFTASVLAMRPKTGEVVWHYQFTPNDQYDYDGNWEMILGELNVDGAKRKVLMQLNRNGFLM